jgi:hypothetical protein
VPRGKLPAHDDTNMEKSYGGSGIVKRTHAGCRKDRRISEQVAGGQKNSGECLRRRNRTHFIARVLVSRLFASA